MIMEAVAIRVSREDEQRQKDAQREQWKQETAKQLAQKLG